jgi:tetratricopeptide (TPR) repeat protein
VAARREETRDALRTAALQLATARTGASGDGYDERLTAATEAAEAARIGAQELDDAALESRALYLLGQLAEHRGDGAAAEQFLKQSAARAEAARDNRGRVRALSFQVYVIGSDPERLGEVLQVAAQAESVLAAVGDSPLLRAQLVGNLGTVKARARVPDKEGAIADLREAVALLTETVGDDHPDVLSARVNLGNTLGRIGDKEASRSELEAAAAAALRVWGPSHPLTARVVGMFGMALLRVGDLAGARAQLEAALAGSEAALGPDHHQVADAHYNLALVLQRHEEYAAAAEHLRIGLEARTRALGEKNGGLIAWHFELGKAELARGRLDAAEETLTRALELCEIDGASPGDFARVRFALARAVAARQPQHAKFLAERAAQTYRKLGREPKLREVEAFLAEL